MAGFHRVEFELTAAHKRNYADLRRLVRKVPAAASVAACEMLVPHVSARENAFTLNRTGAGGADYLLCDVETLGRPPVKDFMKAALASNAYSFVGRSGAFAMWRKGGDHSHDDEGLRIVGVMRPKPSAEPNRTLKPPSGTQQQPQKNLPQPGPKP
jgi:hypothetical protein